MGVLGGPCIIVTVGDTWQGDSLIGQEADHGAGQLGSFKNTHAAKSIC